MISIIFLFATNLIYSDQKFLKSFVSANKIPIPDIFSDLKDTL